MFTFLAALVVVCAIIWFVMKENVPLSERLSSTAKKVENKVETVIEKVADVNKDGVVNVADVKAAAGKTKKAAKIVAEKVKKGPGRKKKSQ